MKRTLRQICALALAFTLLALSGCAGNTDPKATKPAMGRYIETELELPADFAMVSGLRSTQDGVLELLGYPEPPDGPGAIYLHLYCSTDGGKSWTEETPSWLDFFNSEDSAYGVNRAAWAADGTLWFYIENQGDWTSALARLDGEQVTILDWEVPYASDGSGPRGFRVAGNGDLILDCWTEFLQVDPADGKVKNVYTTGADSMNDGWAISGSTLVLSEPSRLVRYDLTTGKEISSVPCQGGSSGNSNMDFYRLLSFGTDGALYFADPTGIYRSVEDNDTQERLADGSLTALATPSVKIQQLFALKDQYLVLAWSNEVWKLYSYQYDPNVPTLPDSELIVWSLKSEPLIFEAVSEFQKREPGVHVAYTVGMPEDGSVTQDDAIRSINTQLLAGKGPDVIVLDGLPYSSYVEKGVLADLSAQLGALDATGSLLSNITSAYKQADDKIYAIPTQFQVPMLHGSNAAMSSIKDLKTMADWLESTKGHFRFPFLFTKAPAFINALYPACASSLTNADGRMDEAKLADFLTQIKRITDLRTEVDESEENNDYDTEFNFGPLGWLVGYNALDLGYLRQFEGLHAAWTASDKQGDGSTDTLFGGKAFLPLTGMGVSVQSKQQEMAWKLIETALSDEVQNKEVGSGMPVNTAAFDATTTAQDAYNDGTYATYGTTFFDAEGATEYSTMEVKYPPEEYRNRMAERLKSLDTPIFYDETVLQIIITDSADYWSGKADLDTTVSAIMQKLKLYEAE